MEQTESFYGTFLIAFLLFLILLAITHTFTIAFWIFLGIAVFIQTFRLLKILLGFLLLAFINLVGGILDLKWALEIFLALFGLWIFSAFLSVLLS
jgi:hypothetical protein